MTDDETNQNMPPAPPGLPPMPGSVPPAPPGLPPMPGSAPPAPPVYYPPAPPPAPAPHSFPRLHVGHWYNVDMYISGYGTKNIELKLKDSGKYVVYVNGPRGREKLKNIDCRRQTWKSNHNINPYRFQHEIVKAVCRYYY